MFVYRRNISNGSKVNNNNNSEQFYSTLETDKSTTSSTLLSSSSSSSSLYQPLNMANVSCRDRTSEFQSAIRTFQSRGGPQVNLQNFRNDNRNLQQRTQFMNAAKNIGKDLTNTCAKLERLTTLAKKRSLFDDKPAEINELTYIIKQDINNLNKDISQLQLLTKSSQNSDNKNVQKHSSNVVITLQSKLATISKDFQHVLEVRNENLKQQSVRKEQFVKSGNITAASLKGPKLSGQMGKSVLLDEQDGNNETTTINMDSDAKNQYKQQLMLLNEQENTYIRDRANAMESVEQTIIELGTIYSQLATLIKEQDEVIQRIDHNVDDAEMNVSAAHGELLKYFQSVTSNRWLIIKIFLVLIIFFVIFVIFMA